jgi:hypothetical protein
MQGIFVPQRIGGGTPRNAWHPNALQPS